MNAVIALVIWIGCSVLFALLPFIVELSSERIRFRELFARGELLLITAALCAGGLGQVVEHLLLSPVIQYRLGIGLAFVCTLITVVYSALTYGKVAEKLRRLKQFYDTLRSLSDCSGSATESGGEHPGVGN